MTVEAKDCEHGRRWCQDCCWVDGYPYSPNAGTELRAVADKITAAVVNDIKLENERLRSALRVAEEAITLIAEERDRLLIVQDGLRGHYGRLLRLVAECDATITRWREVRNHVSAIEQQTRERCANDLAFSVQGCRP